MSKLQNSESNGGIRSIKTDSSTSDDKWFEEFKDKPLHERMKECRKHFGWSQEEAAFQIGISQTSLSKIESGKTQPTIETLSSAEKVYSVPAGYLYAGICSVAKSENDLNADNGNAELVTAIIKGIRQNNLSIAQLKNISFSIQEYTRLNNLLAHSM